MRTLADRALMTALLLGVGLSFVTSMPAAGASPPGGLSATASIDYPERHSVPGDFAGFGSVHAVGVPRGGAFDVIVDIAAGSSAKDVVATVSVSPDASLGLLDVRAIDGLDVAADESLPPGHQSKIAGTGRFIQKPLSRTVELGNIFGTVRIVWTFKNEWEVPLSTVRYDFTIGVTSRDSGDAQAQLTVPLSISAAETTLRDRIQELAEHPFVSDEVVGYSYYGREIHWLVVSDPSVPVEQKRSLLIFATIHGNEGLGAETILDFVQLLLTDPARGHYLQEFVLYIVPLQNPDGHEWLSWYNLDFAAGGSGQACTKPSIDGEVPAVLSDIPNPRDPALIHGVGGPCGLDLNFGYPKLTAAGQFEALATLEGIRRYEGQFYKPILAWTHQWGEFLFQVYAQVTLKDDPALGINSLAVMNYIGDQLDARLSDYGLPQIIERLPEIKPHAYWLSNPSTGADTRGYARSYVLAYHGMPNLLFEMPYWNTTLLSAYLEHPYILWSRDPAERVPSPIPHRPYKLQMDYYTYLLDAMLLHVEPRVPPTP
jgi:hypothetical protein